VADGAAHDAAQDGDLTQDGGPGDDMIGALDAAVGDTLDTSPPAGPMAITADLSWAGWSVHVRTTPARFALPIGTDTLLLQDEAGGLATVDPTMTELTIDGTLGEVEAGVSLGDGSFLVADPSGVHGYVENMLGPSPINALLSEPITSMIRDPESGWVFFGSETQLLLHDGEALYQVHAGDLPTAPARLAFGGAVAGEPGIWIAAGSSVFALMGAVDTLEIGAWVEGITALDLTTDGAGQVWVVADGDLYRRDDSGHWDWLRLPSPVSAVEAHPDRDAVWIATSDGLWREQDGAFGPVEGVSTGGETTWLCVEELGTLITSDATGVHRFGVGDEPLPPPPPTWTDDIEPLATERCLLCHGPGALGANQMHTQEQWMNRIDDILLVVTSGAMPLPPNPTLDPATIQRIQSWKNAGFPN